MSDWCGHWWQSENIGFLWAFSVGNYWGPVGKFFIKSLTIKFLKLRNQKKEAKLARFLRNGGFTKSCGQWHQPK
jgi:hypothetical protein